MAKRKNKKKSLSSFFLGLIFLFIISAGYYVYNEYLSEKDDPNNGLVAVGEISFHFMMLGNEEAGDCTYIKAGDNDILIDAGSNYDSVDEIKSYIDNYVTDGVIEYLIVTHAHLDHIACLAGDSKNESLFDLYEFSTIIDFPKSNSISGVYNRYKEKRQQEIDDGNTAYYTALQCYNNENGAKRSYNLTDNGNVKFEILYNYFYENKTSNENDYSVCVMFYHGTRQFLFTGDLEERGEQKLVDKYDFTKIDMFKAGHHGSTTASNTILLKEIKPKIVVVPCIAGSVQYSQTFANTFPTQEVIDRLAEHESLIYAPAYVDVKHNGKEYVNDGDCKLLNGNIVVVSEAEKGVYVNCSNNNIPLQETQWFKDNRTWS